ncbi:MAG: hypothetical protein LBH60_05565 [Prevotellaceae bacterium]|nr:hypothetical protein [Prevotellaceae bacterium]
MSGQRLWLNFADRENYYDSIKTHRNYYVDEFPDTLLFEKRVYFLRQSPLSFIKGYTNIFYDKRVDIDLMGFGVYNRAGAKGYHVTWIIRNDSLFVKNVVPRYMYKYVTKDGLIQLNEDGSPKVEPQDGYIPEDTVVARFEKFIGTKFKNGMLHTDWVNGDFGVITSYIESDLKPRNYRTGHYRDGREKGFIMTFKNGKFKKIKKDKRKFKN